MAFRAIRFDPECDAAAESLGGYAAIDDSLNAHWDGLHRNPEGYSKVEMEWGSVRYIRTKRTDLCPELIWYFSIDARGDVLIYDVDLFENLY